MRCRLVSSCVTLLVLCTCAPSIAQQKIMRMGEGPAAPLDYEFPAGQDVVSVPFRHVSDAVLIPVTLGNGAMFWVTLDTGMPADRAVMLWDKPAIDSLGLALALDTNIRVAGAGGKGEAFSPRVAGSVSVRIGDLSIRNIEIHTLPPMKVPFERDQGVIGRMLFANFTVELDFDNSTMRLYRPGTFHDTAEWSQLPLTFQMGNPFVDVTVVLSTETSLPVYLVLDLGAAHALSLYTDADPRLEVPHPNIETTLGYGLSGPVVGQLARVASLKLGGFELDNVICTFPDRKHQMPRGPNGSQGNLGCGALSHFNLIFDYSGSRLFLRPSSAFSTPFEYDMSGLVFDNGQSAFTVTQVRPGSPAAEAEMQVGDRIVEVDNQPVSQLSYPALRERLKQPGTKVSFGVERSGRHLDVAVTLRRLI